jgi:uncharacterized iron-regulated membrane protein
VTLQLDDDGAPAVRAPAPPRPGLRPLLWRLHFLGGFLAAPVVLSLALTGILFAWNPQIEAVLHREALTAVAAGPDRTLGEQVTAARETRPAWSVATVVPATNVTDGGEQTTAVTLSPPGGAAGEFGPAAGSVTVYVDPASARVTGEIAEARRPGEWLRSLHSSWRLGPVAEPVTELAASWVLVSLLTGVYLWWPRRWRWLHSSIGMVLLVPLLALIGSGLSWTTYAGGWIDGARAELGSTTPVVSTSLDGPGATAGHEGHASRAGSVTGDNAVVDVSSNVDGIATTATRAGLPGQVAITPPAGPGEAWTVARRDSRWPVEPTTVAIDPATGTVLDRVSWADYPLLAKATTLGIAFHQAELFGLANQIGLTALATGLIVLILAGYRMWWLRRPVDGFGAAPPVGPLLRNAPVTVLLGLGLLLVLLPTLGVAFVLVLVLEQVVRAVRSRGGADHAV